MNIFFTNLDNALDAYSKHDKVSEHRIEPSLLMHKLRNPVKKKNYFKNVQNPSCIDLSLTNNVYAFQQTITICPGLSDCHKLVLLVL